MELKALIFDVDGTLADTERDGHRVAFNRAFAEVGLDWEWSVATYGELLEVTGGKERIQHYLKKYCSGFQPSEDIPAWAAMLHKAKTKHYKDLLAQNIIPLRPGVKRLIAEARSRGLRLAIATTTTPENVSALLGDEGMSWFEIVAAGDIVPAKKPAPDIYQYVLEQMNLSPDVCLAFEDSQQGLRSSLAAGLRTVITQNDYTQSHDFTNAQVVLDNFGEPDAPFQVLAGSTGTKTHFDVDLAIAMMQ